MASLRVSGKKSGISEVTEASLRVSGISELNASALSAWA